MEEPTDHPPGLFGSLKGLWRTILATAHNRAELLLVEVEEERRRAVEALLLAVAVAVLGMMALIAVSFLIVVICWNEHRVAALAGLSGFYLMVTAALTVRLRVHLKNWRSFPATIEELKKDKACLEEKG